jgi:ribosomal protein S18 acetylase RimI-like enzyme
VVQYRNFRNDDPPRLVEVWNEAFVGRGGVRLRNSSPLERHVFAKPYFDPAGLFLAEEDGQCVGFAHAGFGANESETALSYAKGVTCVLGVRPTHRRRGIGSELLRRCENYLREHEATTLYAGQMRPLDPFYLGLYGGSELPGFLLSDPAAAPFFEVHGYRGVDTCLVFQRRLDQPVNVPDGRFAGLRRRYEVRILPRLAIRNWWQDCVLGLIEPVEFRLEDKATGAAVAQLIAWEMEGFSWRWNQPSVGILDLQVHEEVRRQGLAKLLLTQLLRYLQEQYFGVAEVQTLDRNQPAINLYRGLGFEQVDVGRIYRREPGGTRMKTTE